MNLEITMKSGETITVNANSIEFKTGVFLHGPTAFTMQTIPLTLIKAIRLNSVEIWPADNFVLVEHSIVYKGEPVITCDSEYYAQELFRYLNEGRYQFTPIAKEAFDDCAACDERWGASEYLSERINDDIPF